MQDTKNNIVWIMLSGEWKAVYIGEYTADVGKSITESTNQGIIHLGCLFFVISSI